MALQTSQVLALGVEDVYLCIVQRDNDVLVGEMQTGYDTLIWGNLSLVDLTTSSPGCFDLIFLLEVRAVSHGLRSSTNGRRRQHWSRGCSIQTFDATDVGDRGAEAGECGVMYAQSMSGKAERRSRVRGGRMLLPGIGRRSVI